MSAWMEYFTCVACGDRVCKSCETSDPIQERCDVCYSYYLDDLAEELAEEEDEGNVHDAEDS